MNLLVCRFLTSFRSCLRQMCGLARLSAEVEALRAEAFSSADLGHERALLELWALLQGERRHSHATFALV